jgi:hypothetical protein
LLNVGQLRGLLGDLGGTAEAFSEARETALEFRLAADLVIDTSLRLADAFRAGGLGDIAVNVLRACIATVEESERVTASADAPDLTPVRDFLAELSAEDDVTEGVSDGV